MSNSLIERIEAMRRELKLPTTDLTDHSPQQLEKEEALLRYLVTIDKEPTTTLARQLITDGIELPPPDALALQGDDAIFAKLWEIIHGLAKRCTVLYHTDHLSDLELYDYLWHEPLNDPTYDLDDSMGDCACHLDLLGDLVDDALLTYLTYYADDFERVDMEDYLPPNTPMPEKLPRPYKRDHLLPTRLGC